MIRKLIALLSVFIIIPFAVQADDDQVAAWTIDDVSRLAIARNIDIAIARETYAIQEAEPEIARSVYDTHLDMNYLYTRDEQTGLSVFSPDFAEEHLGTVEVRKKLWLGSDVTAALASDRDNSNSSFVSLNPSYDQTLSLEVMQPLWGSGFGFVERWNVKAVELDTKRFSYHKMSEIERLVYEVRTVYWQALKANESLFNARQGLSDAKEFHEITLDKLKLGLLEEPDRLASLANVKRRESNVIAQQNRAKDFENELKTLLEYPLDHRILIKSDSVSAPEEKETEEWTADAMEFRYDRKKVLLDAESKSLRVKISESARWPRLDLSASMALNGLKGTYDDAWEQLTDGETPTYSIGVLFSHPLENRAARSEYLKAKRMLSKSLLEIDRLERTIENEVDASVREVASTHARVKLAAEIVKINRDKLSSEMKRFQQGRSGSDLIIDYQNDILVSRDNLAEAVLEYRLALDARNLAAGSLLHTYIKESKE